WIGNVAGRECEPALPNANSLERRTLAEIGPLRFTRVASERNEQATGAERGKGTEIEALLRVADLQGRLSWRPIDLSTGRFPFDVVRSIAVVGNTLYVGTDAGLQVYDGTDFALERALLITLP